jgi:cold shock CspA family protein
VKLQGKVTNWSDDKGFGFVEPNGGSVRAFVHIKAFNPSSRRPVNGEIITYELVNENNNRWKAKNIKFSRDLNRAKGGNGALRTNNRHKGKRNILGSVLTVFFCIGLLISIFNGKVPVIVGFAY